MKVYRRAVFALLTFAAALAAHAQEASQPAAAPKVSPILARALPDIPGKEVSMLTVEYAPGGSSPAHRHNASVFVYVLEGSVVMKVEGGKEVTLTEGQTFYESPSDIHAVSRNASATKLAKILVFSVKEQGAPVSVPVPAHH
jgi:quercetin dioxygenase-like cupin family protein